MWPPPPVLTPIAAHAPPADPRLAGLDLTGWTLAAAPGARVTLTRLAMGDQIPGFPQVWIRTEPPAPRSGTSTLQLYEIDCAGARLRMLEDHRYTERDMKGQDRLLRRGAGRWTALLRGAWPEPLARTTCENQ